MHLSKKDQQAWDRKIGALLDAYRDGKLDREAIIGGLGHVVAAIAMSNRAEFDTWILPKGLAPFLDEDESI